MRGEGFLGIMISSIGNEVTLLLTGADRWNTETTSVVDGGYTAQ